jgi:hypothetical protein
MPKIGSTIQIPNQLIRVEHGSVNMAQYDIWMPFVFHTGNKLKDEWFMVLTNH